MKRMFKIMGLMLCLGVAVMLLFGCADKVELGEIQYFTFITREGSERYSHARYALRTEEDGYVAEIKPAGVPDEEVQIYPVDADFVRQLEQLLRKGGVESWNGFNKSSKTARDGSGFDLTIIMADESLIEAGGYMKWPKNYEAVRDGLDALFGGLVQ